jgi:type IV pilus assembly protein PilV
MKKSRGFSFVEIMVCVVILSTGLLGLMGLQATALKNSTGAYYRTQAALLAKSMAERIRLNYNADPNANSAQSSANDQAIARYLYTGTPPASWSVGTCLTTTGCSGSQMAGNDAYEWRRVTVPNLLPLGKHRITCITEPAGTACSTPFDGTQDVYTITITWDENRNGVLDNRDPINPALPCFVNGTIAVLPNPKPQQYDPCFRMNFKL